MCAGSPRGSVAAELRIRYHLERVYGIARSARYLRSRGGTIPPFPQFGDFSDEADSEVEVDLPIEAEVDIPIEWEEEAPAPAPPPAPELPAKPRANTDALAALIEDAATSAPSTSSDEPAGRERRHYVRTLADAEQSGPRPAVSPEHDEKDREDEKDPQAPEAPRDKKALGRIAIRKVAVGPRGTPPVGSPVGPLDDPQKSATLADAARAIRRGGHRDQVAELVVFALERFAPQCAAAVMLVIRGTTATGWRHFCRSGATPPELAVPLDEPGLVPQAVERTATTRGKAADLGPIDQRLLRALDTPDGDLAVVPVAIAGKVMCVIVVAIEPDAAIPNVETVATSAGTAFARLLRDAGR